MPVPQFRHSNKFLNYFNSDVEIKNGLDMLIYQALMSIDIWLNDNLSPAIHIEDLRKHINLYFQYVEILLVGNQQFFELF